MTKREIRKIDWTPKGALEHLRRFACEPEDEDACDVLEAELVKLGGIEAFGKQLATIASTYEECGSPSCAGVLDGVRNSLSKLIRGES